MKITSFNPIVVVEDAQEAVALFEELGFQRRHTKQGIETVDRDNTVVRMKDKSGFRLDITQAKPLPPERTAVRINVDDFDEAYELLISRGFTNIEEDQIFCTTSSIFALMKAPTGFLINLCQHVKT